MCDCITVTHKIHHNDPKLITPKKTHSLFPAPLSNNSVHPAIAWNMSLAFLSMYQSVTIYPI